MATKVTNNAISKIVADILADDTSITLVPGTGAKFPVITSGDWFPATLIKETGEFEIVRVTARVSDVLTVVRGQETTAARAFTAGDRIEHRLTAAIIDQMLASIEAKFPKAGGTIEGDVTLVRPGAPTTGALFFGNTAGKYLFYDGTNFSLAGGQLTIAGQTAWNAGNFNPASYMPLAGGNFTGGIGIYNTSPTMMFYDTDWGPRQLHANGGLIGFLTSGGGWGCYSDNAGNFIASANIGAYSDRKHKKQIKTIRGGLELVEAMRGVRYVDKRTGAKRVGVIAQEVMDLVPEVVGKGVDGLHVDYGNLVAVLIPAVQELAARLRALEARDD